MFIKVRLGGRRVHIESLEPLGSSGSSMVAGAPWVRRVPLLYGVFICVNWGSPWGTLGLSGVSWFIGVRPGGRQVHPGCLGSSCGVRHGNHWVHMGTLGLSGCALGVVEFNRDRWVRRGSPWVSTGSSWLAG